MTTQIKSSPIIPQLKPPALYRVIIFDDDISTYTLVMDILVQFFNKTEDQAYELAKEADIIGTAIVGMYPKDIAETKIALANKEIRAQGYPLHIEMESCD